ncbi:MAG: acetyltransferase [Comamonas sp.]
MRLLIVGAGGHGKSVAEAALASGSFTLSGFLDDQAKNVWEFPVFGGTQDMAAWREAADVAIVAIGNNLLRQQLQQQLMQAGYTLTSVIHPRATVSPSAELGVGSAIMAGSIIGTEAKLGVGVIVNSGAVVDHNCVVGNYGHLGVASAMAGGTQLGAGAWMQAGAALGCGVEVLPGAFLSSVSAFRTE